MFDIYLYSRLASWLVKDRDVQNKWIFIDVAFLWLKINFVWLSGLVVGMFVGVFLRSVLFFWACIKSSQGLHKNTLWAIIRCPMKYFDFRPAGICVIFFPAIQRPFQTAPLIYYSKNCGKFGLDSYRWLCLQHFFHIQIHLHITWNMLYLTEFTRFQFQKQGSPSTHLLCLGHY